MSFVQPVFNTLSVPLSVANGGSGRTSLTSNNLLSGNGTSTINLIAPSANSVLQANGSSVPSFNSTLPNTVQDNITRLGTIGTATTINNTLDVTGHVKLGPAGTIVSDGKLNIRGTAGSSTEQPRLNFYTTIDDKPTIQMMSFDHDNSYIFFDGYLDGFDFKAANSSTFLISKSSDFFRISADGGNLVGDIIDPVVALAVGTDGTIDMPQISDASIFVGLDPTKKMKFDLNGITASTTRTITVPNSDITLVGIDSTQTLTNKSLTDNTTSFIDNSDATKKMQFELSGITTGTTRTLTVPNASTTIVGTDATQTLTNKSLTDNSTSFIDNSDSTKKMQFELSGITTGTTRTLTVPNASTTIVGTDNTATLTNKTISGSTNTVEASALRSATTAVVVSGATAPSANQVLVASSSTAASWGTAPVAGGGTGQSSYTNGQLLIGNTTGNTLTKATLTAGYGTTITNGAGSITIAHSQSAWAVRDIKTANTNGGTATAVTWVTRTLNTLTGTTSDTSCTLASNVITLTAGIYHIYGTVPGYAVTGHASRLFNVTSSGVSVYGTNEIAPAGVQSRSIINQVLTVASTTDLRVEHYCKVSVGTSDFGIAANVGSSEVYSDFYIIKLA